MAKFEYDENILAELKDIHHLKPLIEKYGYLTRSVYDNPIQALVEQIISQQINTKTAVLIHNRMRLLTNNYELKTINNLSIEQLKECGISLKKAQNIKNIFNKVNTKELDFSNFQQLTNQEIINILVQLDGIGPWSAEMFLLFYLQRIDVISYGDYGIMQALKKLYNLEKINKKDFKVLIADYQHYGSIISFYLWKYFSEEKKK